MSGPGLVHVAPERLTMIGRAHSVVDAQTLISMSLLKIQSSRTQRGGIKLHKNLLVSCVLRSARQVYLKEKYEVYRRQQYEEVLTVCDEIQELDPLDQEDQEQSLEDAVFGCQRRSPADLGEDCKDQEQNYYRSCCMEAPVLQTEVLAPSAHCNKTTVLDLDTHVVTTVENMFLHQDCELLQGGKRKKELDCELEDWTLSRKRARREDPVCPDPPDCSNISNISNLISIFGSGFSGLLSRHADLENICSKHALASLGVWTRTIVAF